MKRQTNWYGGILFTLLIHTSIATALAPLGPPRALIGSGHWHVGGDLSHSSTNLEAYGTYREVLSGVPFSVYSNAEIKNLKTNALFAQAGYGLHDNWDIYGRLGLSDARGDLNGITNPASSATTYGQGTERYAIDSSMAFAWGLGSRVTFLQQKDISWGTTLQMNWYNPKPNRSQWIPPASPGESVTVDIDLQYWEIQLSAGPTINLGKVWIYGGPFLHFVNGDLDYHGTWFDNGTSGPVSATYDVREQSIIGGFVGAQWIIADNIYCYLDGQATGDAWGLGIGTLYRVK
ncbi:hypothetical protein ACFL6U_29445 [Planctomycetota bacterium]